MTPIDDDELESVRGGFLGALLGMAGPLMQALPGIIGAFKGNKGGGDAQAQQAAMQQQQAAMMQQQQAGAQGAPGPAPGGGGGEPLVRVLVQQGMPLQR
jgi:hypothetical protein